LDLEGGNEYRTHTGKQGSTILDFLKFMNIGLGNVN